MPESFIVLTCTISWLQVYYRTTRPVPANTELMVFYGPSYASDLGIDPNQQLTVYQIYKNPGESYFVILHLALFN